MTDVFANGREVSGKATPNKTIAAFPDVCLSPPPPPAGPVPIPYPNFGMASDTSDGCSSVFVKGKEAGKKNASKYSKITGDEPATNGLGAGVVSHKITGPLKFAAYSFDVMFEGSGAERLMDLTTTNHMNTTNGAVGMSIASAAMAERGGEAKCERLQAANEAVRKDLRKRSRDTDRAPTTRENYKEAAAKSTITHGIFTAPGGGSSVVRACSRALVNRRYSGSSKGMPLKKPEAAGGRKPSRACGGHTYAETRSNRQGGAHPTHTESRIIEDLFKPGAPSPAGGKLLLAIDWETAKPPHNTPRDACDACKKLLCKVDSKSNPGKGCIEIKICHGDPATPKSPKDIPGYCD